MRTLEMNTPPWATPSNWFALEADSLTDLDDDCLLHSYRRLVAAELVCADHGAINLDLVRMRRWAEWCIGQRLGDGMGCDGKPVDPPPAFQHMTVGQRRDCRAVARLDGDVLFDHLRRSSLNDITRAACLRIVDREVA